MNAFDNILLLLKKYFFSGALIIAGIILLIAGIGKDPITGLEQTKWFTYGGIVILALGLVSLLLIMNNKNSKILILGLSVLMLLGIIYFTDLNIKSIKTELAKKAKFEKDDASAKQSLSDLKSIQDEHDKKYQKYAVSFPELKKFVTTDSAIQLVRAEKEIPDRRMTLDEMKKLGIKIGDKRAEVISEVDAIALDLIIREYKPVPIQEVLFGDTVKNKKRIFDFDIDSLEYFRPEKRTFSIKANELDSTTTAVKIWLEKPTNYNNTYNEDNELSIGSLEQKKMNSNWKD